MTIEPPNEVLEESLSAQELWRNTAGTRPPQPPEDRAHYEMLWRQNFILSNVDYPVPVEVLMKGTPTSSSAFEDNHFAADSRELSYYGNLATDYIATDAEVTEAIERLYGSRERPQSTPYDVVNKQVYCTGSKEALTVLIKGYNAFGTTFIRKFDWVNSLGNREADTVAISIASYRVVEVRTTSIVVSTRFGFGWIISNECRLYYIVQEEGQVRPISCNLPQRRDRRYDWCLEAIFRFCGTRQQGDSVARQLHVRVGQHVSSGRDGRARRGTFAQCHKELAPHGEE